MKASVFSWNSSFSVTGISNLERLIVALHAGRLDADGDGSDAVANAPVALTTASHLLAAYAHLDRRSVHLGKWLAIGACHARPACNRAQGAPRQIFGVGQTSTTHTVDYIVF